MRQVALSEVRMRTKTSIIALILLAAFLLLAGYSILFVSSAHGHGLASGDRDMVIVAWTLAIGCIAAAAAIGRS